MARDAGEEEPGAGAPHQAPDLITGSADRGLLQPSICPSCGRSDPAADEPSIPEPDGQVDRGLGEVAHAWIIRLQRDGASVAYFVELRDWLARDPQHLQAYREQLAGYELDPLRPLRRP